MKKHIFSTLLALAIPFTMMAQKITLGSCKTHDNGQYKGQMQAGKPHGKGNTLFENGDTYEGEYVKESAKGKASIPSLTEKSMMANGFRTNSTDTAHSGL